MIPTNIDGTDITGATIDGTDVQEITVDGQTVFTASALPDSAIHQWKFDEGSGTTATDSIGSINGTLQNGLGYTSNANLVGGFGIDLDGNNDFVSYSTKPAFFDTPNNEKFAIAITINDISTLGSQKSIWSWPTDDNGASLGTRDGDLYMRIIDSVGNVDVGIPSSSVPSSGRQRILANCDNGPQEVYINNTKFTDTTVSSDSTDGGSMRIGTLNDRLSGFQLSGVLDNAVIYNDFLTPAEVQEDFDAQPWS